MTLVQGPARGLSISFSFCIDWAGGCWLNWDIRIVIRTLNIPFMNICSLTASFLNAGQGLSLIMSHWLAFLFTVCPEDCLKFSVSIPLEWTEKIVSKQSECRILPSVLGFFSLKPVYLSHQHDIELNCTYSNIQVGWTDLKPNPADPWWLYKTSFSWWEM